MSFAWSQTANLFTLVLKCYTSQNPNGEQLQRQQYSCDSFQPRDLVLCVTQRLLVVSF